MTDRHSEGGLRAHSITVGYGKDSPILEGLSLDVLQGELTVIVGPNACGKSTLLRALARVLSVRCGVVELDGQVLNDLNQKALARRLGLLAQSSVAPGDMLVEDLVARGRYPHQSLAHQWSVEDDEAVARAMCDAGVSAFGSRRVGELSGGQRQRVWIAMALAQSTDILLLDEPTTYLDIRYQIAVLHDLHLAFRYATHLVCMKDGRIVAQGVPRDIVTPSLISDVFEVECVVIEDPESGAPLVIPRR